MPKCLQIIALISGIAMAICQWFIFVYAPNEAVMGIVQKIFYIHLPLAWWAFMSFFVTFVASIAYLRTRNAKWDAWALAAAEVGTLCSGLAIVTGSIWARHSWGVWWTWDPRLTTALIMWFVYMGYLILRGLDMPWERNATVRAVVGIIAFIDVPLVFLSARLWRSIHPAVFASKGGGLDDAMKTTVFVCLLGFAFVWASLVCIRKNQLQQQQKLENLLSEQHETI